MAKSLKSNLEGLKNKMPSTPEIFVPKLKSLDVDVSHPRRDLYRRGSIIHASKENIFEFPVFISSSISGNMSEVTAVNDLLTQLYASYVQIAVSSQPIVDIDSFKRGQPFKAFKTDINQYLEYCDTSYQKDACHATYKHDDGTVMEFDMLSIDKCDEKAFCEYALHEPLSEFSHYFQEANGISDEENQRRSEKHEWEREDQTRRDSQEERAVEKHGWDRTKHEEDEKDRQSRRNRDASDEQRKSEKHEWERTKHTEDETDRQTKRERDASREQRDIEKHNIEKSVKAGRFIDGSKINKLNSLTPMMMTVSMNVEDNQGNLHRQMEYVVGVKTHCRIVDSDILPEVIEYPVKNMNKLTRKAKWRAGEMTFWEYLFKTKAKKQTAVDSRDPRRKWYRRLYELAHEKYSTTSAQIKQMSGKRGIIQKMFIEDNYGLMPNATIILSMQDCYNIKDETGIDILDPKIACKFCDDMFLMCLMVMDVDNDNLKILTPDTHNDFDIQSLDSVQKQVAALDPSKARAFNSLLNNR